MGTRVIVYNQRGYSGSTPLTNSERLLEEAPDKLAKDYVLDLVYFLKWICTNESFPIRPIVVGWSKGTNLLLGISTYSFLDAETRSAALECASAFILYEPPGNAFGIPVTEDYTNAMNSPDLITSQNSEEKYAIMGRNFSTWIAGFYKAGDSNPYKMSSQELGALINTAYESHMIEHGFYWKLTTSATTQQDMTKIALVDQKDIPIALCWNGETAPYLQGAAKRAKDLGANVFLLWEGGNHLAFAHEPERWLKEIIRSSTIIRK